jgi:carboxypeptidase family protein
MRFWKGATLALAAALAIWAQGDRGTITGTVADPAGAVVANAVVEAKNADTGTAYQAGSSTTGNYTLAQMPVGTYELSVSVPGFKKSVRPGIIVSVAATVRVDFTLEVGAATESVTVQAEAPLLKTESGELSHTVDYNRLDSIPLLTLSGTGTGVGNIRNPLAAASLMPGSVFSTDNTLRINGMPSSTAAIRVEGMDATNGTWRQITQVTQSGVDAIQEVAIQTSNFAAEYGQAGGGYFNYTMKSGTNQIHGSAYDYFDNEALNAGIPYTSDGHGHALRNSVRRNDFGFTLGGPVVVPHYNGRDKTFFFVNFEQFREGQFVRNGIATVPTDAYRNGDFSRATFPVPTPPDPLGRSFSAFTVFDPNSTFTGPGGVLLRNPYSNFQVPSSQFDTVSVKLQALIPHANVPNAGVNNYAIPGYSNFRHTTIPSIKIDQSLSSTMKISGYMSVTRTESPSANGFASATLSAIPQDDTTYTTRINFDDTLRPTLLLHMGIGLLYYQHPQFTTTFDQSNYWAANAQFAANQYAPSIGAANNVFTGGVSMGTGLFGGTGPGAPGFANVYLKDIKPTANTSLTWVKGNHTFKTGGELVVEGFPQQSLARANGGFNFTNAETANPWDNGNVNPTFQTGFPYASFLLGQANSLTHSAVTDSRLGSHAIGLFIQDTWKVTRKFTIDYGIRYDYQTLLKEQYGRMQNAAFNTPNPVVGNRLGSVVYEATCGCSFNHNYPWALGPRLGAAYQITSKTVFRAGAGLAYSQTADNAFLSYSVPDFYTLNEPGWGIAAGQVSKGNPYAPGNPYGNPVDVYPNFTPQFPQRTASGTVSPAAPFISIDRNSGRPARILQWSIGLQREVARNLVVEAEYVGNRGVWWTAPVLAAQNYNALTPQGLLANRSYGATQGIDINSAADRALLTTPISSPAVVARYPLLANANTVYPGFPSTSPLNQALRPFPQWLGIPPFLGPPLGTTWYDSLQTKVTKRYSHGLDVQGAFTWQKELTNGVNSGTSYFTPGTLLINDVFNRPQQKQISSLSRPFLLVISFNYTTPKLKADGTALKALSWVARDWVFGSVLRYQSGLVIQTPPSSNNFFRQLARTDNPAIFGGGNTFENRVPGVSLLNVDPNCHCFNPQTTLPLNPKAWSDAAPGTFGTSAPYYNDYRWQRQPAESFSLGRNFPLAKEGRVGLNIRAEFYNVFNRVFLTAPSIGGFFTTNSNTGPSYTNGVLTGGYGYINTTNPGLPGFGPQPRTGQIVARFSF